MVGCHCPTTGRIGDLVLDGLPCLLSRSHSNCRKTSTACSSPHACTCRSKPRCGCRPARGRGDSFAAFRRGGTDRA
ncbi:hypothetical protein [Actinoallomurus sp. CA-150999]|uniref:hypothetical protein n=1 Tax=Actinoallomurus sp. CA-150999 TaxID=3239887 RepID=UPI003D8CC432